VTHEVEHLYERARELPRDARAAFIDGACRGNAALRDELASLLEHADAAEQFFDRLGGAVRAAVPAIDRDTARQFASDDQSPTSSASLASSTSLSSSPSDVELHPDPMIGQTIGRYHVLALLGRGGMGNVYRAHDDQLDRDVALKFLPPHGLCESGAAERFLVEARAAAALVHPNVCTVHEIGRTDDGRPFIAMAHYEGETLKQRLSGGPLPPREAAVIARELASALGAAHARGIVHRDVKPGNVMLARDGLAKLLDFGLAQVGEASLSRTEGVTPGTIAYMSPEQARGDLLDHRSDLWSLGVVLYEMLVGERPFRGGRRAVLHALVHAPPEPLAASQPTMPPALACIVERLLQKAPEDRYPDAAAVEADLSAALRTPLEAVDVRHAGGAADVESTSRTADVVPSRSAPFISAPPRRTRRRVVAVAAAVGALAAAASLWNRIPPRATEAALVARSLVVMPFVDMSADTANRYFVDGLSEEITTALGRIGGLRVAARTSAFALRDRALDVRRIGDTLGVDAVLEGSVRRAGRRLRVTAKLADSRTGLALWANEYDREVSDVIAVQDEIARAIAEALELRLPSQPPAARAPKAMNFAAYDLYLRALQLRNSMSADAMRRATDLLDRATELQPDFAPAYGAKASVLAPRVYFRQLPMEQGVPLVRAAIARAFALDPNNGEAYVSLGLVQLFFEWDWAGAERSLRRAVELEPNDAHAWHQLGNYYRAMGRPDDAADARLRGLAIDPLNVRLRITLGEDYLFAGRLKESLAAFERAVQLDPVHPIMMGTGPMPPTGPARVYLAEGREADAVRDLLRVATLRGESAGDVAALSAAFQADGMQGFWRRWLVMQQQRAGASIDPMHVSMLYALAGNNPQALSWLERAYAERNPSLIFIRTDPAFVGLRTDPRYQRIEQAMRFPTPVSPGERPRR
jgi:serine/threonine-protein kinase